MKSIIEYINEVKKDVQFLAEVIEIDGKHYYKITDDIKIKNSEYYPISFEDMNDLINNALNEVYKIIKIFNENELNDLLVKSLGRIWERSLAKVSKDFSQGNENNLEKDLIYDKEKEFSVELKTTKNAGFTFTGNKSYAVDIEEIQHKEKNSFYLFIKYKLNHDKNGISDIKSFFGYVYQKDWKGASKGNSASLNLIEIKDRIVCLDNYKNENNGK